MNRWRWAGKDHLPAEIRYGLVLKFEKPKIQQFMVTSPLTSPFCWEPSPKNRPTNPSYEWPSKMELAAGTQRLDPNVNEFYLVKRLHRGCHKLWHPHSCGFKNKFNLFLTVFISWHTLIYCFCWKHTCPYASTGKHRYHHQWFVWRWGMPQRMNQIIGDTAVKP